jgi:hypothetical protein
VLSDNPRKEVPYRGRDYSTIVTGIRPPADRSLFLLDRPDVSYSQELETVPVGKELRNIRLQQVSYTTYNSTTTMATFQIKFIATFELMTPISHSHLSFLAYSSALLQNTQTKRHKYTKFLFYPQLFH